MFIEPVSLGISAVGSIIGAVGKQQARNAKHEQALKETRLRNQQMMAQYKRQLKIRNAQIKRQDAAYNLKKTQYNIAALNLNKQAAAAYLAEEANLNEIFKQAKFTQEQDNVAREKVAGKRAARGQTGASAARGAAMDMAAFGRSEARRVENLFGQTFASDLRREKMNLQYNNQALNNWASVSQPPLREEMPEPPTQLDAPAGPGNSALFMDLAQGAVGALGAGIAGGRQMEQIQSNNDLKAELIKQRTT